MQLTVVKQTVRTEFLKFKSNIVLLILVIFIILNLLMTYAELRRISDYTFEQFIITINANFSTIVFSVIPFVTILSISKEFSSGFAMKIISNNIGRKNFLISKYLFSIALSFFTILLYILYIFLYTILYGEKIDAGIVLTNVFYLLICSLFINVIITSVSMFFRNWTLSIIAYYVYSFIESFLQYLFLPKLNSLKYLPVSFSMNILKQQLPLTTYDLFIGVMILLLTLISVFTITKSSFYKADLL